MLAKGLNRFLFRYFPPPAFLMAPSYGLDISDQSLKFVQLIPTRDGIQVVRYGERKIPPGVIESGKIKNLPRLQEILLSLRKEGIRFVRVSLPEEQVYLFPMRLEKAGLKNMREGIELALEEHVPMPAKEAIFDYDLVHEDDRSLEVEVAAASSTTIENYISVFRNCFISVQSLELEAQAIARAVIKKGDRNTYLIVDFGQTRTGIFIASRGVVVFTSTLDIGGVSLNAAIAKSFGVNPEEAERLKMEYGLRRNAPNKEIFPVLLNSVSVLRDEIVKHFLYWNTHQDEEGKTREPVKKIIFCGGDANLIGLSDYISQSMKMPVELANVWTNISPTDKHVPEISMRESLGFATAIGLALGDFDYD